ncbi:uncharacterized protein LOC111055027 isoform X2 [Nilaparvata lugens]|nr:uncharacterized protein LOC111055027 isoform X2 [Nilaparvata lugens]
MPGTNSFPDEVAPSADYPYIINEVNAKEDSWQNVVQKRIPLLEDADVNTLFEKYKSLTNSNDPDVSKFLYTMLIQHSLARLVLISLKLSQANKKLLKEAVQVQLEINKSRVLNDRKGLDLTQPITEKPTIEQNQLETILKSIVDSLKHRLPEMELVEQLRYIIHTTAMEYISLSLVDTHISSFLSQLFGLFDQGRMYGKNNYYYDVMIDFRPAKESLMDPYVEGKDGADNLMQKYFQNIDPFVDNFLRQAPRNKQQIHFQNQLLVNHCILRKLINELSRTEHKDVYYAALKLKLDNFKRKLDKVSGKIFEYTVYYRYSRGFQSSLTSMVDFENDPVFSGIPKSRSYKQIKGCEGAVGRVLAMWISQKIVLAIIDDADMFTAINQCFSHIEKVDSGDGSFCNGFVADGSSILDKMGCKGCFIPVFQ